MNAETAGQLGEFGLLPVAIRKDDLMILYSSRIPVRAIVSQLRVHAQFGIGLFYRSRQVCMSIDEELRGVGLMGEQLSGLMSGYFAKNTVLAIVDGSGRRIRATLSRMHGALRRVAELEVDLKAKLREMKSSLERDPMLEGISQYLTEHAEDHDTIDREAHLSWMGYAASEALNLSVIQATMIAAIVGAVVGGLMVLFLN